MNTTIVPPTIVEFRRKADGSQVVMARKWYVSLTFADSTSTYKVNHNYLDSEIIFTSEMLRNRKLQSICECIPFPFFCVTDINAVIADGDEYKNTFNLNLTIEQGFILYIFHLIMLLVIRLNENYSENFMDTNCSDSLNRFIVSNGMIER